MGHGHSHDLPDAKLARAPRIVLTSVLVVAAVATLIGLVWLWPHEDPAQTKDNPYAPPAGVTYHDALVQEVSTTCSQEYGRGAQNACRTLTIVPDGGTFGDKSVPLEILGPAAVSGIEAGDSIRIMELPASGDTPASLAFAGVNRHGVLLVLTIIFVIAVLAVARWKGLFAIVGLVFSGAVLLKFVLPALLLGKNGIAVALVGSTAIMFVVLYVAHGISWRTSAAFAGTLLGLVVTAVLGIFSVDLARLSGVDENGMFVSQIVEGLSFQDLLSCALVIAGLGVLNDVTITQSSAVWEIRAAAPNLSRMKVFASGMRIGRDHIASTIYTIVFAYAGAALTLLLLVQFYNRPLLELITTEEFGAEIVRTLASAIGLVLSVPITTGIAAMTLGPASLTVISDDATGSDSGYHHDHDEAVEEPAAGPAPRRAEL